MHACALGIERNVARIDVDNVDSFGRKKAKDRFDLGPMMLKLLLFFRPPIGQRLFRKLNRLIEKGGIMNTGSKPPAINESLVPGIFPDSAHKVCSVNEC